MPRRRQRLCGELAILPSTINSSTRRADERARVVPTTGRLRRPVLALPLLCFVQVSPLFFGSAAAPLCAG